MGALNGPGITAVTPALCLLAYVGFGKPGLIGVALGVPILLVLTSKKYGWGNNLAARQDPVTGLASRNAAVKALDQEASVEGAGPRSVAALAVGLEEFDRLAARIGDASAQSILREVALRLDRATREWDLVVRLDGPRFGIALTRLRRVDMEVLIEIAARVQRDLSEPYTLDGTRTFVAISVGICCPPVAPEAKGSGLVLGAERALDEALTVSGGAIRRYSEGMRQRDEISETLGQEAYEALEDGRVRPWFQPQISTDTGQVTGVEALARWEDPETGPISPGTFLPAMEAEGLTERLCHVMLSGALAALRSWDEAGLSIPNIGINVSEAELRNPMFADRVRWELDRQEIAPGRLTIEVLESVAGDGVDDMVARNIASLARLGCGIDIDDFGTGNASVASLRRFTVHRIKIDRSYVTKVDVDAEQQAMVAAIVTMAEQLKLETLAEGVETPAEHAMAAQLGCLHVQGFAIARPMPLADCTQWLKDHAKNAAPLDLSKIPTRSARPGEA